MIGVLFALAFAACAYLVLAYIPARIIGLAFAALARFFFDERS